VGVRVPPAQGGHGWRREHHIANLPQAHKEDTVNLGSWWVGELVS
jgi:hypothetical protein